MGSGIEGISIANKGVLFFVVVVFFLVIMESNLHEGDYEDTMKVWHFGMFEIKE